MIRDYLRKDYDALKKNLFHVVSLFDVNPFKMYHNLLKMHEGRGEIRSFSTLSTVEKGNF